jgi:hypothetical protein
MVHKAWSCHRVQYALCFIKPGMCNTLPAKHAAHRGTSICVPGRESSIAFFFTTLHLRVASQQGRADVSSSHTYRYG